MLGEIELKKKRRNRLATEQNQVQLASILQAPEFISPAGRLGAEMKKGTVASVRRQAGFKR